MSEGKTFLLRSGIFAVLASLVTTVIYLTPVPEIEFASCERPCHALMWPMICRVKLTVELYQSMSRACGDCPANTTDCFRRGCVATDGFPRGLLTVDRQIPGPTINVCKDDILLVDVVNRASGHELSMHWRGQPQREAPMMDGVPMVTQCPIASNTIFQYKFRASRPGTHLYHAFTGSPAVESVFGALVVREADTIDTHAGLYDEDSQVVVVSEWRHGAGAVGPGSLLQPDPAERPSAGALLFNGRTFTQGGGAAGRGMPPEVLTLKPGRRHRLRLALAGGGEGCSVRIWAERHPLSLIELDGSAIAPKEVSSLTLAPGERADVVVLADQTVGTYWLRAASADHCAGPALRGAAVLRYEGAKETLPSDDAPAASPALSVVPIASGVVTPASSSATAAAVIEAILNDNEVRQEEMMSSARSSREAPAYDSRCGDEDDDLCFTDIRASNTAPSELTQPEPYMRLVLPFGYKSVPADTASAAGIIVPQRATHVSVPHVNNITFLFPSSPVLTQPRDVERDLVCNEGSLPYSCATVASGGFCQCTHVVQIPYGATVELLLINQGGDDSEGDAVLHMHGYSLHVAGIARLRREHSAAEVLELDRRGALLQRELARPLHKDTVVVPRHAVLAARFKADNAGYWMLHEERPSRWAAGLAVLLHVGADGDTPTPPDGFPTCGSFVGPHFFLV